MDSGQKRRHTVANSPTTDTLSALSRSQYEVNIEAADYLLSHGLTVPYESHLDSSLLDDVFELVDPTNDATGLTSWEGLPECSVPATVSAAEKWEVNDRALALLQEVYKKASKDEIRGLMRQVRDRGAGISIQDLKLELPCLRTDEATDLRNYQQRVENWLRVDFTRFLFPTDPCDNDKDEGLEFPPQAYAVDANMLKSVEDEKIEVPKAALKKLQSDLNSDWTEADQAAVRANLLSYPGLNRVQPVTPPLSPLLQAQDAFVPDPETCAIPISSETSSILGDELRGAEEHIFAEDSIPLMSTSDLEQFISFTADDHLGISLPRRPTQTRGDLKVDVPLVPGVVGAATPLSPGLGRIRETIPADTSGEDKLDAFELEPELVESMRETADKMMREIEQEKLDPIDASVRVNVPVMDFSIPQPEWSKSGSDARAIFRSIPKSMDVSFSASRWTKKLVDESRLGWRIWTARTPKPSSEDPINDQALLDKYLGQLNHADMPNRLKYVRNRPGLMILEHDLEDDEELQPLTPIAPPNPAPGDWMTLLRKRKAFLNGNEPMKKDEPRDQRYSFIRLTRSPTKLLIPEEEGATAAMLHNYLELHAPKKLKLGHSPLFMKQPGAATSGALAAEVTQNKAEQRPDEAHSHPAGRRMPCPKITKKDSPLRLIASVTVSRGIIKHLERLLPGLQIIDRDYRAHNTSTWVRGSVQRSEVIASALEDEADLIPCPSTGIILTTMIKVRQRQLPTQASLDSSKKPPASTHLTARVERVAARYERLIVLVSEDNRLDESANDLSASDAAAFTEFQGFAAGLVCETVVVYVGGGVETLTGWAASLAARYMEGAGSVEGYLSQEESHWEIFLRRAGLNIYAAQVVLGLLRAPPGEMIFSPNGLSGLPAFVNMGQEQRSAMFEGLLGGGKVLARVGEVLDAGFADVWKKH